MISLYKNIKKRRRELGLTQEQLAKKLCYRDKSTIAKIETGKSDLPQSKIIEFAKALETTPAVLMGWSTPASASGKALFVKVYDTIPFNISLKKLPAVDEVIISQKLFAESVTLVALKIKGDSMYPEYLDGDIVVVQLQNDFYNNEDYAVFINNNPAIIRRLYKDINSITLKPINTNYLPATYNIGKVSILGKVIEIRRKK